MKNLSLLQITMSIIAILITITISSFTAAWAVGNKINRKFEAHNKKLLDHEIRICSVEYKTSQNKEEYNKLLKIIVDMTIKLDKRDKVLGKLQSGMILLLKKAGIPTEILSQYNAQWFDESTLFPEAKRVYFQKYASEP